MENQSSPTGYDRTTARRAGWLRVGFALTAVVLSEPLFPALERGSWVLWTYLAFAAVVQWAIVREVAPGDPRSLTCGAVDTAVLTYLVMQLGLVSTVLPFMYVLIPVLYASSSSGSSRAGMHLSVLTSVVYSTLLILTGVEVLPYAPGRTDLDAALPTPGWLALSGTLVVLSVLVTTHLVTRQVKALHRMNRRLSEISRRDELTELYNRRFLLETLAHHLHRVRRGANVGLMMVDLDGFKRVNDVHGHAAGDRLLRAVAQGLQEDMRSVDLVARYGGDEFVVLLPDLEPEGLQPAAARAADSIARIGRQLYPDQPVTASVGLATARADDDLATLIQRADAELYRAKRTTSDRPTTESTWSVGPILDAGRSAVSP